MKIKYLKNGKLYIVITNYGQQILFSNKSKNECYEWMFKKVNYA